MTHTPTPWELHEMDNGYGYQITSSVGGSLRIVAIVAAPHGGAGIKTKTPKARANAAHIVRCVNVHNELADALELLVDNISPEVWEALPQYVQLQVMQAFINAKAEAVHA